MLNAARALDLNVSAGAEMPQVPALRDLYALGLRIRKGEVGMVIARSGNQKSGLAMFLSASWNVPTLYFAADQSPFTTAARIAGITTGMTTQEVEHVMTSDLGAKGYGRADLLEELAKYRIQFSFGKITWPKVDAELQAYVELHNCYPELIVYDNLMDIEDAVSDYDGQMQAMQEITNIARHTGATSLVLHHVSDKSVDPARRYKPPAKEQAKNGLGEKPEFLLGGSFDPDNKTYNIAVLKQRMGPADPSGNTYATLRIKPEFTRFEAIDLSFNPSRTENASA